MNYASGLEDIAALYSEDEIEMFAIDVWDGSPAQVQIFYNNSDWTHPILMRGGAAGIMSDYDCGYDYVFIIDADGIIRWRGAPFAAGLAEAVEQAVAELSTSDAPVTAAASRLLPGYPNPFNPMTTIPFQLADGQGGLAVKLEILDVRGRVVRTLVDGFRSAGIRHEVQWDGTDETGRRMPSGTYMSRLRVGGQEVQCRLVTMVK